MKIYQHSTLLALMGGLYQGTLPLKELLKQGNLGIGTLDDIDGELIVLEGKAYQATSENIVREVNDEELIPYAAVAQHQATLSFELNGEKSLEEIKNIIEEKMASENLFYSIKISGKFSKMHVRMVPKQERPYTKAFIEVAANQPEYKKVNQSGTIVGFYTPALFHGVSVEGFHLHFLNDSRDFGGHVLDFESQSIQIELGVADELVQHFPVKDEGFLNAKFDIDKLKADIVEAE